MKIAVLLGGDSPERDVSLDSGKNILEALTGKGYECFGFDPGLTMEQLLKSPAGRQLSSAESSFFKGSPDTFYARMFILETLQPDLVFNALHGGKGENGIVQALLETMNLKYTASGPEACMLSMDKLICKPLFEQAHIPTARSRQLKNRDTVQEDVQDLGLPLVIKPADGGSTLGLSLVRDPQELESAFDLAVRFGQKVMAESYIRGREIAAGVLNDQPLPLVHIQPKHELYDYECKYTSGMSAYTVPADLSSGITETIQKYAVAAFRCLGCEDYARVDFLLDNNDVPFILEVNTLPGMTSTSLLPKAAKATHISFEDLIERIVKDALNNV